MPQATRQEHTKKAIYRLEPTNVEQERVNKYTIAIAIGVAPKVPPTLRDKHYELILNAPSIREYRARGRFFATQYMLNLSENRKNGRSQPVTKRLLERRKPVIDQLMTACVGLYEL
jgi:hypothetical protein